MKIAMICGSWPPERCGIADYTELLCQHLENQGAQVVRIAQDNWGIKSLPAFRRDLRKVNADVYHVQYPAVGYKRSLLPALTPYLCGGSPCVVTLHEYEIFKAYRRLWFAPYARKASARIFSRQAELAAFAKAFPARIGQDLTLPIGSNIPKADAAPSRYPGSVVFFGLFWPGKGLEEYLSFVQILRESGDTSRQISIVGAPAKGQEQFAEQVRRAAKTHSIKLHENLPASSVAQSLAAHEFAYLPFPEGADERRGTLAAALVNGCRVITPHRDGTPDWLAEATQNAKTPRAAAALLAAAKSAARPDERPYAGSIQAAAKQYDWSSIAVKHLALYRDALTLSS
ncbi:hypothetical protein [Roseibium polysiphoniae]|nr:hypothetical protein [Roseibium polysiphoniae]